MKHLILAATFALIAAPAFADGSVDATNAPKAKTFTDTQVGGYTRSYDADSNRAKRDANLRRAEQNRSENARSAARGLPHYY
ncbi:MAG: hypothetical protein ABI608_05385 [Rhizomicrobium sp.]